MKKSIITLCVTLLCVVSALAQNSIVWDNPRIGFSKLSHIIKVKKVEFSDRETTVSFHFTFRPGQQIGFLKTCVLQADGKEYKATSSTVIKFDEPYTVPANGQFDFTMSFEPLPTSTKYITFTMPNAFYITDIHDRNMVKEGIIDTYWRNDNTGDWMIGFTEKNVIFDCQIWDITSWKEKKDAYDITAVNGKKSISINIGKQKNGQRTFTIGKEKSTCSIINSEFLPDYPTKDNNTTIADNNFRQGDSVTIIGWYKNMPKEVRDINGQFTLSYRSLFTDKDNSFAANMDSLGRFQLRFPVENSELLYCDWGRSYLSLPVEPNETYFILRDFKDNQTLVMGNNARLQNEMLGNYILNSEASYNPDIAEKLGAMPFLYMTDSINNNSLKMIDEHFKLHPTLSERCYQLNRNLTLSETASNLMQASYSLRERTLPNEYLDFVKENFWNKISGPYSIYGNNYSGFFRDYSLTIADKVNKNTGKEVKELIDFCEEQSWFSLTESEHKVIDGYTILAQNFFKNLEETPDSLKSKLINDFNSHELTKKTDEIFSRKEIQEKIQKISVEKDLNKRMMAFDSQGWNQTQKDFYLTQYLYRIIDGMREPLNQSFMNYADSHISTDAAKEMLHSINEKYENLGKHMLSPDMIKSSDEVKDLTEGEQILRKIIEPYKGKIILMDIWGTWCGPCKEALSHSQEEYEHLKDYDIVYLFLANRSSDESWKNVIKEYNIIGDNVVHYNLPENQQRAVENYVGVTGFPTYKLIDQQGNLLDINADPRNIEMLEKVIKKLSGK